MVPTVRLALAGADFDVVGETRPHGRVQGPGNLIILFQPRTAAQDLGQPELAHGALHVSDLALGRSGRADPLRWFTADTTDHVGVSQGLGGALGGFCVGLGGNGLGDPGVQRRGATGHNQRVLTLLARGGPVASGGSGEGGIERGGHDDTQLLRIYGSMV